MKESTESSSTLETVVELTEIELEDHIDTKVSEERIQGMIRKMKETEDKLAHLEKVRDRWQTADNTIKVIGLTITFLLTFITTLMNAIPTQNISSDALKIVTAIFSSIAALSAVSAEGTIVGFTSKNKAKFVGQIRELEKQYHKCYLFYERARADKKITNDELVSFYSIFQDKKE